MYKTRFINSLKKTNTPYKNCLPHSRDIVACFSAVALDCSGPKPLQPGVRLPAPKLKQELILLKALSFMALFIVTIFLLKIKTKLYKFKIR